MVLYQVSVVLIPPLIGFSIKCITYRSETGLLVIQTLCTIEDSDCALLFLLFIVVVSCLYNNKHSGCDMWWRIYRRHCLEFELSVFLFALLL